MMKIEQICCYFDAMMSSCQERLLGLFRLTLSLPKIEHEKRASHVSLKAAGKKGLEQLVFFCLFPLSVNWSFRLKFTALKGYGMAANHAASRSLVQFIFGSKLHYYKIILETSAPFPLKIFLNQTREIN